MLNDTIVAVVTPMSPSGVGIIRISGDDSINVADSLFNSKRKRLRDVKSHTINYGHIVDPKTGVIVDEVLVSVMKNPKSYTKEDVVEINSHGGVIVIQKILKMILEQGVRLAEPGEFTKRAFLNGRIDLSQAEAVMDIISAKTEMALESSVNQLKKSVSDQIDVIKSVTLELIAHIEASIDYPEYDIEELSNENISNKIEIIKGKISVLMNSYDDGKIIREGIKTVIVGKPNVGKSSLLNTLLNEQRAIVTDIPGTTRDVLEEYMNIHGIPLRLIDTAGIRQTEDFVEKIGVSKSKEKIDEADLVLMMIDASSKLSEEDIDILKIVRLKKLIIILNKIDLEVKVSPEDIEKIIEKTVIIPMSLKELNGINLLENEIKEMFTVGKINFNDYVYITNVRHKNALMMALNSIKEFEQALLEDMPLDLLAIDLRNVYEAIGQITGDTVSEDLINQIFSQFCLGK